MHRFVSTAGPQSVEELFDRRGDRFETRNVLAEQPEVADRLRAEVEHYLESTPPWEDVPTVEIDEMEANQLRALGYAVP